MAAISLLSSFCVLLGFAVPGIGGARGGPETSAAQWAALVGYSCHASPGIRGLRPGPGGGSGRKGGRGLGPLGRRAFPVAASAFGLTGLRVVCRLLGGILWGAPEGEGSPRGAGVSGDTESISNIPFCLWRAEPFWDLLPPPFPPLFGSSVYKVPGVGGSFTESGKAVFGGGGRTPVETVHSD
jgi:hypothetical protein